MNSSAQLIHIFSQFLQVIFLSITTIHLYISVYKIYIMTDRYWRKIEDVGG